MLYRPFLRRGPWLITVRGLTVMEASAFQGHSVAWWLAAQGPGPVLK